MLKLELWVNGKNDIDNKIIRMIGEPELRIKEDPLRILRTIRFAYKYNFKIDNNTKNAIIENKHLLKIISRERIWEEIKKSFSCDKNHFNIYLNYITEFNMWEDIFTNSNINTKLVDSANLIIIIANLFKNESKNNLENKLVQDYKMDCNLASKVVFLISLLDFNIENIYKIYKIKIKCGISDKTIIEYININNLSKNIFNSFIKYKPTVSSKKLMNIGFSGKELGIKIRELEADNFKKIMNKNK
jgi:tRNA nucleotidyltransferase/poly(A) polymerase